MVNRSCALLKNGENVGFVLAYELEGGVVGLSAEKGFEFGAGFVG